MEKSKITELFYKAILTFENIDECRAFFEDACTPKEIQAIAQRFAVAKMLSEGKVYNDIVEATGASTATISRVNRAINKGFRTALERLDP